MKSVIYINNDTIQYIKGSLKKREFHVSTSVEIPLEHGTVVNGIVFNPEKIVEALRKLNIKGKVDIVLDSSNIQVKSFEMPFLNKKQMLGAAEGEFGLSEGEDEIFYSLHVLDKKQGLFICCAAPKTIVKSHVDVLQEAGIKIGKVDVLHNSIIKYILGLNKQMTHNACVNVLYGDVLLSYIFSAGKFVLANRTRILSDPNSPEFVDELYKNFSSILQFTIAKKNGDTIAAAYYIGLEKDVVSRLDNITQNYNSVPAIHTSIATEGELEGAIYPATAFIRGKNDIDLYVTLVESTKKRLKLGTKLGICLLLIVIAFAWVTTNDLYEQNKALQKEKDTVIQNIEEIRPTFDRASALLAENLELQRVEGHLSTTVETVNAMDPLTEEEMNAVFGAAKGINISTISYDAQENVFQISGSSPTAIASSAFAQRLDDTGLFSVFTYQSNVLEREEIIVEELIVGDELIVGEEAIVREKIEVKDAYVFNIAASMTNTNP